MKQKILFAWDFHGTLEKGNINAVKELCGLVLKDFGIERKIELEEIINWYGLSWLDYFKRLVPKGNDELWHNMVSKVLSFQDVGWEIIKRHIKPMDFSIEVLERIKSIGHKNILITNSGQKYAEKFVGLVGMSSYMDCVIGVDTYDKFITNKDVHVTKAERLRILINKGDYKKVVMIGDRESDVKAGKSCGAVTYFFASPDFGQNGRESEADFRISDLRQVLQELEI